MNVHPNQLSHAVIGAAIEVHRALGPGLLESAYQRCLARELAVREVPFQSEVWIGINYKGITLPQAYRLDFLIARLVVVEIKAVDSLTPIDDAQLLTYLKLGGWALGLLIRLQRPRAEGWHPPKGVKPRRVILCAISASSAPLR